MNKRILLVLAGSILIGLTIPIFSQVLKGSTQGELQRTPTFRWSLGTDLIGRLTRSATAGPRLSIPISKGPTSAMAAAARRSQPTPTAQTASTGTQGMLLSPTRTTLLSGSSPNLSGPGQTESAMVSGASPAGAQQQPVQARPVAAGSAARTAGIAHSLVCMHPGISDVNGVTGTTSAIIFLEPGKNYVIHGCGFGTQPGEAYLTGVKYQSSPSARYSTLRVLGRQAHPDWIRLIPTVGADPHQKLAWTDTEIQVLVDPNASGFYDAYWDATVLVIPSGKPQLQSVPGFGFWAARAPQTLPSLAVPASSSGGVKSKQTSPVTAALSSWFIPGHVIDGAGHPVQPNLLSPSAASLVLPGHTFAVVRDDNASSFSGSVDTVELHPSSLGLNIGFLVSNVQLFTASLSAGLCQMGSNFSTSGNWNTSIDTSQNLVTISWQEQSCGGNGISAYAIDITVVGPRGVVPM